jgi:hypothetical protein
MVKNVYILTYCKRIENLYGTILVFKTLRTGFPTANIHVFDNASLPTVRHVIRQHTRECGATFTQLDTELMHHDFIKKTLKSQGYGAAIFVDPDVCFWESVEDWNFEQFLIAGRLLPGIHCSFLGGVLTRPRLHTSLFWIPDTRALFEKLAAIQSQYFEFDPFRPIMFKADGIWQRFDTAGTLYSALPEEQIYVFAEKELNAYDHIFSGTHIQFIVSTFSADFAEKFVRLHEQAKNDYTQVRGAWRWQEDFFKVYTT